MGAHDRPKAGTLTVGDTVIVLPTRMGQRNDRSVPTRAVIVKRGRVWIDVEAEEGGTALAYYDRRFRLDTQHNGSGNTTTRGRFVTEAQYAWDLRRTAVGEYLRGIGITVERTIRVRDFNVPSVAGPWYGRELELANLLRRTEGLDPL